MEFKPSTNLYSNNDKLTQAQSAWPCSEAILAGASNSLGIHQDAKQQFDRSQLASVLLNQIQIQRQRDETAARLLHEQGKRLQAALANGQRIVEEEDGENDEQMNEDDEEEDTSRLMMGQERFGSNNDDEEDEEDDDEDDLDEIADHETLINNKIGRQSANQVGPHQSTSSATLDSELSESSENETKIETEQEFALNLSLHKKPNLKVKSEHQPPTPSINTYNNNIKNFINNINNDNQSTYNTKTPLSFIQNNSTGARLSQHLGQPLLPTDSETLNAQATNYCSRPSPLSLLNAQHQLIQQIHNHHQQTSSSAAAAAQLHHLFNSNSLAGSSLTSNSSTSSSASSSSTSGWSSAADSLASSCSPERATSLSSPTPAGASLMGVRQAKLQPGLAPPQPLSGIQHLNPLINSSNTTNNHLNDNHHQQQQPQAQQHRPLFLHHHHHHHHHHHELGPVQKTDADDLDRIRNFIEQFKARRGALGLTQKQAAQCFRAYTNDRYSFSDNFVGHFEGFQFRPQTAMTIADSLADWLEFAEAETRQGRQLSFMAGKVKETRKRKYEVIRIRDSAKRVLVEAFEKNKSPSTSELEQLSKKTNIPSRNIEIFFKNRRTSRQYHQ